jgi:O-antigen/teichoic acid export membrane protein
MEPESPHRGHSTITTHLRDIVRHGGIFGIGLILARLTSVVLLPVYTRILSPTDYGILAVLDIVSELLRLTIGTALTSSVDRFHFDRDEHGGQSRVWWTALTALAVVATVALVPVFALRTVLARVVLGPGVANGATLFGLALAALWFAMPEVLLQNHLRVMKRSNLYVTLSLCRLAVNASLNVMLLYHFKLGVAGVLLGNLVTGAIWTGLHVVIFRRIRGGVALEPSLLKPMVHFGMPLMVVALLSMAMHQVGRYFLLAFVSLHDIGIYSFAQQIGQGVNSLILSPFSQIWSVVVFEIARLKERNRTYVAVFTLFTRCLILVLLAASLASRLAVKVLAPPQYGPAADLIPLICLAYFFFSLDDHFRVPALVRKRTITLLPVYGLTVALTATLNFLLVPRWGMVGAAWSTVGTFIGFAVFGLMSYRRVDVIDYPIKKTLAALGAAVAVYLVFRVFVANRSDITAVFVGGVMWLALAAVFLGAPLKTWLGRPA